MFITKNDRLCTRIFVVLYASFIFIMNIFISLPSHAATGGFDGNLTGDAQYGSVLGFPAIHLGNSSVSGNIFTMESGSPNGYFTSVFSGWSNSSVVQNNKIIMNGGTVYHAIGGYSRYNDSIGNHVKITGGEITQWSLSGYTRYGSAIGNTLTITGGSTSHAVGGLTWTEDAIGNIVNMSNGKATGFIYGGYANASGDANGNQVFISGDAEFTANNANGRPSIAGGYSISGNATGNQVTISDSANIAGYVSGAYVVTGTVTGNKVTVNGGTLKNDVVGGFALTSGSTSNNSVIINGGTFGTSGSSTDGSVVGGYTPSGDASGNTVKITDGLLHGNVYGGYSKNGDASGNAVVIEGGTFNALVTGGYSENGNASGNTVMIKNGIFTSDVLGGRSENASAFNTNMNISGGDFAKTVTAAYAPHGAISGTTVYISGGDFKKAVTGAYTPNGAISGTTVNIDGGKFEDLVTAAYSGTGNVTNTHMTITGGNFTHTNAIIAGGKTDTGSVTNNTITIDGAATAAAVDLSGVTLTGGQQGGTATASDLRSGNRLILKHDVNVDKLENFEFYEFYLNHSKEDATLTANHINLGSDAKVSVYLQNHHEVLYHGDEIKLVSASTVFEGNIDPDNFATATQGFHILYDLELKTRTTRATEKYLAVSRIGAHPHSRAFIEGRLASFAFMNQGTDLIAGQGIASALSAAADKPEYWGAFTTVSHVNSKYQTTNDSEGDTKFDGLSMLAGLSKTMPFSNGDLLLGGFFEMGTANLNAKNEFKTMNSINTDGKSKYYGGGVLTRFDHPAGIYLEGFLRAGILNSEYNTSDIRFSVDHDSFSAYLSTGAALGYQIENRNKTSLLDIYSRYSWSRLQSEDETIDDMEYQFETIYSQQVRLGARYTYKPSPFIAPYIGAAWQYEFNGDAEATVREKYELTSPSISGSSGIFELGATISSEDNPLSLNVSVEAYIGEREGTAGHFRLTYTF